MYHIRYNKWLGALTEKNRRNPHKNEENGNRLEWVLIAPRRPRSDKRPWLLIVRRPLIVLWPQCFLVCLKDKWSSNDKRAPLENSTRVFSVRSNDKRLSNDKRAPLENSTRVFFYVRTIRGCPMISGVQMISGHRMISGPVSQFWKKTWKKQNCKFSHENEENDNRL